MGFDSYLDICEELHHAGLDGLRENQPYTGLLGGCYDEWLGAWQESFGERLRILFAEPASGSGPPGIALDNALTIACGEGAVRLVRLQRAGKAVMEARELLRGFAVPKGTTLS